MSILNDLRHIVNGIGHSINTRPSNIIRTQKERAKLNYAYQRGIETGIERVRMYGPGADIGPLNVDWRTTITSFAELIRQDFKIICARAEGLYRAYPVARRAISLLDNNGWLWYSTLSGNKICKWGTTQTCKRSTCKRLGEIC